MVATTTAPAVDATNTVRVRWSPSARLADRTRGSLHGGLSRGAGPVAAIKHLGTKRPHSSPGAALFAFERRRGTRHINPVIYVNCPFFVMTT